MTLTSSRWKELGGGERGFKWNRGKAVGNCKDGNLTKTSTGGVQREYSYHRGRWTI